MNKIWISLSEISVVPLVVGSPSGTVAEVALPVGNISEIKYIKFIIIYNFLHLFLLIS